MSRGLVPSAHLAAFLFAVTACFDSGASRGEEGTGRAYEGKNSGGVFRRRDAAILGLQREGSGEESEPDKQKRQLLHECISV